MSKERQAFLTGLLLPLVLAGAAWINAHASKVEAESERAKRFELSDDFQDYIEYQMAKRGCQS